MKNFNRDNRSGGSSNRRYGDKDSGRPQMHQAICSECGKECEVPFRPTGDRPIFCNNCFPKHDNKNSMRFGRKSYGKSNFDDKQMYQAICAKCGNKCEVPFQPTSGKPVYCNQCFDKSGKAGGKGQDQFKQQFEILNTKLDKILKALIPVDSIKPSQEAKTIKTIKAKREIKKNNASKVLVKTVIKKVKTKKKK